MTIDLETNIDLSIFYYIKNTFADTPLITVVDEFPDNNLVVPSVAVDFDEVVYIPGELGNTKRISYKTWFIDVFASNKTQRQSIGYKLRDALELNIPVYDYNEGFPPEAYPSQIGSVEVLDLQMEKLRIKPEYYVNKERRFYYRATVSFQTYYNQL